MKGSTPLSLNAFFPSSVTGSTCAQKDSGAKTRFDSSDGDVLFFREEGRSKLPRPFLDVAQLVERSHRNRDWVWLVFSFSVHQVQSGSTRELFEKKSYYAKTRFDSSDGGFSLFLLFLFFFFVFAGLVV